MNITLSARFHARPLETRSNLRLGSTEIRSMTSTVEFPCKTDAPQRVNFQKVAVRYRIFSISCRDRNEYRPETLEWCGLAATRLSGWSSGDQRFQ